MSATLDSLSSLSSIQKGMLSRAGLTTDAGLLALTSQDLCKKLKTTPAEVTAILEAVATELAPSSRILSVKQAAQHTVDRITTGDVSLDDMLGGGIRRGVVTELVGESASGKTQLALQISLLVQLPREQGGVSGSACYLTTNGALQTTRLAEIVHKNPAMASGLCKLDDIHTRSTPSIPELKHTLAQGIPQLARSLSQQASSKSLAIVVLDSMGALFRSDNKTSSDTLFERSRALLEVASTLHHLASSSNIAILVLNQVNSVFDRPAMDPRDVDSEHILYSEQARWFSRSDSVAEEASKEAGLGLVWANQVGIRVMMTRTGRRRYLAIGDDRGTKRRRLELNGDGDKPKDAINEEAMLIRRISVIFSSFSPPCFADFIITASGIVLLADDVQT